MAVPDIEPFRQMVVVAQRSLPALVGDCQRVRQCDIVERIGRGARHSARHVGDTIMDDIIDDIGRVLMGGRLRGFETATLVDGDIAQYRAGPHGAEHVAGHQFGRFGSGDQHRADHQIGLGNAFGEIGLVRETRLGAGLEMGADRFEYLRIAIENSHVSAETGCHLCGVEADHAAADDRHLARRDAGDAAEQNATTAMGFFERGGAGLDRHAPGDLAHRLEQRQAASAGDGLIGNADRL